MMMMIAGTCTHTSRGYMHPHLKWAHASVPTAALLEAVPLTPIRSDPTHAPNRTLRPYSAGDMCRCGRREGRGSSSALGTP